MRSWQLLIWSVAVLAFCAGGNRALPYAQWWMDGHLAIAEAKDALEAAGVEKVDEFIKDIAPDTSRLLVAGHIRTSTGTQPFCVQFRYGSDYKRMPVKITVGRETLLPSPQSKPSPTS